MRESSNERTWHWSDTAFLLFRTVIFFLILSGKIGPLEHNKFLLTYFNILWITAWYAHPYIFWRLNRKMPWITVLLELILSGSLLAYFSHYTQDNAILLLFPAMASGFLSNKKTALWAVPAWLLLSRISPVGQSTIYVVLYYAYGFAFGRLRYSHLLQKELVKVVEEKNAELIQYAKQVQSIALLEERNRLAQELHDTLGHTFISVIVGLDVAIRLLDSDPLETKNRLITLRSVASESLDNIRKQIHDIAPMELDLSLHNYIPHLCEQFSRNTETKVDYQIIGNTEEPSIQVKLSIIRCLQELLTNAKKHGKATLVKVKLSLSHNEITLTVEDNGIGIKELKYGFGLKGIKDRMETLQGEINIVSTSDCGVKAVCIIPVKERIHGSHSITNR